MCVPIWFPPLHEQAPHALHASEETIMSQAEVLEGISAVELARIVPLAEAARLSGMSEDTLRRHYRDKLIQLTAHRLGMRIRDALLLDDAS
jgi:hypothetical protein